MELSFYFKVSLRRSTSAPPYSTSIGRASGAAKISQGNNNLQTNMDYPLDNCGPENGSYFVCFEFCEIQIKRNIHSHSCQNTIIKSIN